MWKAFADAPPSRSGYIWIAIKGKTQVGLAWWIHDRTDEEGNPRPGADFHHWIGTDQPTHYQEIERPEAP